MLSLNISCIHTSSDRAGAGVLALTIANIIKT